MSEFVTVNKSRTVTAHGIFNNISMEHNCIYIDETYARLKKEDIFSTPKSESSDRVVYLPPDTMDILKSYLDKHPDIQDNDRVFPIGHRAVEKALERHIEKSNVRPISPHCLRHSHTAYLISLNSFNMSVISQRLGHKDETITSQVYAHVYNRDAMDVAQVMQKNISDRRSVQESNS